MARCLTYSNWRGQHTRLAIECDNLIKRVGWSTTVIWSEPSACAPLEHFRQNVEATINGVFFTLFFLSHPGSFLTEGIVLGF